MAKKKRRKLKKGARWTMLFLIVLAIGCLAGLIAYEKRQALIPSQYRSTIREASDNYDVPVEIIYAVIKTESNFDEDAISKVGARGLMQIMPDTFEWLQDKRNESYDKSALFDPAINVDYGVYYLSYLYGLFKDWDIAFAAYNAGPSVVSTWISSDGSLTSIPYDETDKYVKKVNNAILKYRDE